MRKTVQLLIQDLTMAVLQCKIQQQRSTKIMHQLLDILPRLPCWTKALLQCRKPKLLKDADGCEKRLKAVSCAALCITNLKLDLL